MTTLSAGGIADVAYAVGFRGDRLVTAVAVALAESSGRVEVVNSIGCVGLWQINQPVHVVAHPLWTRAWLQHAKNNARAAHVLSNDGVTWHPWAAYTSGAYRAHLAAARLAAANAASSSPDKNGGASHGVGYGKDHKAGQKKAPPPPKPPKAEDDPDPRLRLGRVFVKSTKIKTDVAEAVTSATLSWSTSEVTQLALTLADPGFVLWQRAEFEKGSRMIYREPGMPELALRISSVTLDGGPAGTGGLSVNARSEGWWKLKKRRGPKVMRKASPTDFVREECKAVGLRCVAEPSPTRTQVHRDVANATMEDGTPPPSSWSTFQRLATELGFWVFEFAGTVYFGKPSWLINQTKEPLQVAMPLPGAPEVWIPMAMPSISMTDDGTMPVSITGIELPLQRFKECRPGEGLQLTGLPPFDKHLYLTTSMQMPLLGNGTISLEASTPVNPDPQPPPKPSHNGGGSGSYDLGTFGIDTSAGPVKQTGSKSALDFVRMALSASNAAYVYGAEASVSDPSPSALDCSELVQWALGRVGIRFVDGSSAQYAACRKITVSQALATRGALLHKEGHIGISLGDGRSVEARNPSAGVGVFRAADIAWTGGGLVPGLRYS